MKLGTNNLPFEAGVIKGTIYGGPFKEYEPGTRRLVGVKMAKEIKHPHEISIPTEDFSIPDPDEMALGMQRALGFLAKGQDIYAGCMGGIGRTGLFMGVTAKLLIDFHGGVYMGQSDPVKLVRKVFKPHAIETDEQMEFVRKFDTDMLLGYLRSLQPVDMTKFVPLLDHEREVQDLTLSLLEEGERALTLSRKLDGIRDSSLLARFVTVILKRGL